MDEIPLGIFFSSVNYINNIRRIRRIEKWIDSLEKLVGDKTYDCVGLLYGPFSPARLVPLPVSPPPTSIFCVCH